MVTLNSIISYNMSFYFTKFGPSVKVYILNTSIDSSETDIYMMDWMM
jgi:hypothetical protein